MIRYKINKKNNTQAYNQMMMINIGELTVHSRSDLIKLEEIMKRVGNGTEKNVHGE